MFWSNDQHQAAHCLYFAKVLTDYCDNYNFSKVQTISSLMMIVIELFP
jgi:hypothetical protein